MQIYYGRMDDAHTHTQLRQVHIGTVLIYNPDNLLKVTHSNIANIVYTCLPTFLMASSSGVKFPSSSTAYDALTL